MTRTRVLDTEQLIDVPTGSHACWVVQPSEEFRPVADALAAKGAAAGEKVFVFGVRGSETLDHPGITFADPGSDFLGGSFDPGAMYAMFGEQTRRARAEGFAGVRVVADMDWLLATGVERADTIAFEAGLDRVVAGLGATVVCAYRSASFPFESLGGVTAVHPILSGAGAPHFNLVAGNAGTWLLSGEIDVAVLADFEAALRGATRSNGAVIDLGGVAFIDVAGMRALAHAVRSASGGTRLQGMSSSLRRFWGLAGLDEIAPVSQGAA